ncbi:Zinc transporter ZIP9 [Smittium culicis]|uniref:Zinc transporter ZIP9 n=1 Tax=Smittium culicis TaxID=133412 RepID=A0A1R1Y8F1_9FUNG|nr:Zinc transporter ZIP9 [Smittium culicis]
MESISLLFITSFAMFLGSFIFGIIPLSFKLSDSKLSSVALLGVGLLAGTALGVIIPEGIETILNVPHNHLENKENVSSLGNVPAFNTSDSKITINSEHSSGHQTLFIGASIIFGFAFMMVLNMFVQEPDLSSLKTDSYSPVLQDEEANEMYELPLITHTQPAFKKLPPETQHQTNHLPPSGPQNIFKNLVHSTRSKLNILPPLFVGIFVHGLADGFALGAALLDNIDKSVGVTIFLALVLHKAPEAFGLVATLLRLGYDRNRVRKLLTTYSLCAPIGAIATNFILRLFMHISASTSLDNTTSPGEISKSNFMAKFAGYILLISGGMLTHVALCHALPEAIEAANSSSRISTKPNRVSADTFSINFSPVASTSKNSQNDTNETFLSNDFVDSHSSINMSDIIGHTTSNTLLAGNQPIDGSSNHREHSAPMSESHAIDSDSHNLLVQKSSIKSNSTPLNISLDSENINQNKPQQNSRQNTHFHSHSNSHAHAHSHTHATLSNSNLALLVGGIFFPLILTIGHAH